MSTPPMSWPNTAEMPIVMPYQLIALARATPV